MKITSFNPMIVTKDAEPIIKLFEELGFEKRHHKEDIDDKDIQSTRMKDANGFYVDVAQAENIQQDLTTIRMNVDDFDEAHKFLTDRGFKGAQGDHAVITESSKTMLMISPSGFSINLVQHLK